MSKVGIFIDYDNVYDIIDKKYNSTDTIDIHLKFIEKIWDTFSDEDIIKFIAFADFTKIKKDKLITELQKRSVKLEHCYSNGSKEEYRKNASDLALCISVMKSIYELDIEKYVLISSDCDMIPILNELKFRNKYTVHIYSPTSSNRDIREYDKDKKWTVVNDVFSIEQLLEVEVYENTINELAVDDFENIVKICLPTIFENLNNQRAKKNEYGFGYLSNDIVNSAKVVKETAIELGKKFKEDGLILHLPDLIGGKYENLRLNKNHEFVKKYLSDKISNEEYSSLFLVK